jgi:hypothetical protein
VNDADVYVTTAHAMEFCAAIINSHKTAQLLSFIKYFATASADA